MLGNIPVRNVNINKGNNIESSRFVKSFWYFKYGDFIPPVILLYKYIL